MLKLELFHHRDTLRIRYVKRAGFLSPTLLKAFAIAIALHAGAYMLFSIDESSISEGMLSPPVEVEMDPHIHFGYASRTLNRIDPYELLTYAPAKPGYSKAAQPALPQRKAYYTATQGVSLADIPLRSIEKSLYRDASTPPRILFVKELAIEGLKKGLKTVVKEDS